MVRRSAVIACVMFGVFGCAAGEMDITSAVPAEPAASAVQAFKRVTAERLAEVLSDTATRERVMDELRRRGPLAVAELTPLIGGTGASTGDTGVTGNDAVPELWLREPEGASDSADLLVAYAPGGNKRTWTEIPAYTLGGVRVTLDPRHAPDVPVLVIETHGRLAMRKGIDEANVAFQRAGLQHAVPKTASPSVAGIPTTRLDAIRLVDDQEPWISGSAEVYAIVSGVVGNNDPQLKIVDLPYLDASGTTYTPNQILVD
jgi:Protein of unknown function (DUF3103)